MNSTNSHRSDPQRAFLATILSRSARAIASAAALKLLEQEPAAAAGFGADPFVAWQQWLLARIEELNTALSLQRPELFQAQVRWAGVALQARGIDLAYFRRGLLLLREALSEDLPEQATPLAADYFDQGLDAFDHPQSEPPAIIGGDEVFGRLTAEYLLAVLEGDGRRASRVVLDAAAAGRSVEDLYLRLLAPAQVEVGRLWLANEISIADEHLSSATARRLMSQLVGQAAALPPVGKTVLTAAVAGNRHDLGTQAVADFFEMDGWRIVHLGADVPVEALVEVLESVDVDLLALSAALAVQLPAVRDTIAAVRAAPRCRDLKILVGGRVFGSAGDLAQQLGADAFAADARQAVLQGRMLVGLE